MFASAAAPSINKSWNASNAKAISTGGERPPPPRREEAFFGAHSIEMCTFFYDILRSRPRLFRIARSAHSGWREWACSNGESDARIPPIWSRASHPRWVTKRFSSVFPDSKQITGACPAALTARAARTVWRNAALPLFVRETSKFLLVFPTVSELQIVGIALSIGRTVDIGRAPTFIEFVHSRSLPHGQVSPHFCACLPTLGQWHRAAGHRAARKQHHRHRNCETNPHK